MMCVRAHGADLHNGSHRQALEIATQKVLYSQFSMLN